MGGRLEAGWRRSCKDLHLFGQTGGRLEAGWRQAGGRLEGVHIRIYTFLAKLEAGWRQAGGRSHKDSHLFGQTGGWQDG